MSKAGKRLIESAQQALDFAEGKAKPSKYRVHTSTADNQTADSKDAVPTKRP